MAPDRFHAVFAALDNSRVIAHGLASLSLSAIIVITTADMLVQASSSTQFPSGVDIEHISLEGALMAAVIVLWRALAAKDVQLTETSKAVTVALTLSASSNSELRKIIEDSVKAKQDLTESQHALTSSIDMLRSRLDKSPRG